MFAGLRARGWAPGVAAGWDAALTERNYQAIAGAGLSGENLLLGAVAVELLAKHKPDTVRGVMYSVVSAGWLPDTGRTSYGRVQRLLNLLRKRGVVPFDWVVDNVRETEKPASWAGLGDFAATVRGAYRKDYWASLPERVEVIVEKDTVAGRVLPVTKHYDVPLHPLRGYTSTSFAWAIGQSWRECDKPITVYYIGDHDPSGRDIERAAIESLREYGRDDFRWHRVGANPEHFERFDIIPLAPKTQDRRYAKFVEAYGPRCAEVEAIPATALRDMLSGHIEAHVPGGEWRRLEVAEQAEQAEWSRLMSAIGHGGAEDDQ